MERKLIGEIRTRQMRFLGHVIRKDGLENMALTGKLEGKRGRGRKRVLWVTSLNAWIAERGIRHQKVELRKWHLERERGGGGEIPLSFPNLKLYSLKGEVQ